MDDNFEKNLLSKVQDTKKINIAMVGYYNTLPFLYGLNKKQEKYNLLLDVPSACMEYYKRKEADIALVPVASLLDIDDFKIVTDYCIGCDGEVGTVCLFSNTEVRKLKKIFLDSDSRTSQMLIKILFNKYWKSEVEFVEVHARSFDSSTIQDDEGILMIGDKTFGLSKLFRYVYDLGGKWKKMTGLPFAFAVWIARKGTDENSLFVLNNDLGLGVQNIDAVLNHNKSLASQIEIDTYFSRYLDFAFDCEKKEALEKFLSMGKLLTV